MYIITFSVFKLLKFSLFPGLSAKINLKFSQTNAQTQHSNVNLFSSFQKLCSITFLLRLTLQLLHTCQFTSQLTAPVECDRVTQLSQATRSLSSPTLTTPRPHPVYCGP